MTFHEMHTVHTQEQINQTLIPNQEKSKEFIKAFVHFVGQSDVCLSSQIKQLWQRRPSKTHGSLALAPSQQQLPHNLRFQSGKITFWLQQRGQHIHQSHQGQSIGVKANSAVTSAGVDYLINDCVFAGLTGSLGHTHFHWDQGRGQGRISTYEIGLYGSAMTKTRTWYVDMAAILGRNRYKSHRKIKFPGFSRTAVQQHWSTDYKIATEVGYTFYRPQNWSIQPYLQAGFLWIDEDAFKEHRALDLNMKVRHKTSRFGNINPGVELARLLSHPNWIFRPSLRLGYMYRRGSNNSSHITASLVGQPGSFEVRGTSKGCHRFSGNLSLSALFKNGLSLHGVYNTELNAHNQIHEGLIRLIWKM